MVSLSIPVYCICTSITVTREVKEGAGINLSYTTQTTLVPFSHIGNFCIAGSWTCSRLLVYLMGQNVISCRVVLIVCGVWRRASAMGCGDIGVLILMGLDCTVSEVEYFNGERGRVRTSSRIICFIVVDVHANESIYYYPFYQRPFSPTIKPLCNQ